MRKLSILFVIVLLLSWTSYLAGQEVQRTDTSSYAGKKALTFSFNGLYLGGGLGGTLWLSNDYALRLLLSGSYYVDKDLTGNNNSYSATAAITAYLKRHFHAGRNLTPYVGAGIGLSYSQSDYYYYTEPSRSGSVTVPVIAGVEYWLTDNISLSGEQTVGFSFSLSRTYKDYRVSSYTSSLLLSIYF